MERVPSHRSWLAMAICGAVLWAAALPSHAEDKASREREALRRAQQSLRQTQEERDALAGEKASLEQAKSQLDSELKQTSAKVKGAEARATAAHARLSQLEASLKERDQMLADSQEREKALQARLGQSQAALAEKSRLAESLAGMLKRSTEQQNVLQTQNRALYETGLALIDLYRSESPSVWLKRMDEPLGLHGVKVENIAEAFRTRLDDARYKSPDKPATP